MPQALRILLTTGLTWTALCLHLLVCACYLRRWDKVAAITVFPFWAWGLSGAILAGVAWLTGKKRLAAAAFWLWTATILTGSDETRPLLRLTAGKPAVGTPSPANDRQPLRIVTLNCHAGMWNPDALKDVEPWQPDILFLQEAPVPLELQKFAARLYGNPEGHWEGGYHCGILSSGLIIAPITGYQPYSIICTVEIRGKRMDVACVHLQGAETSMELWSPEVFRSHSNNRQSRRSNLNRLLHIQGLFRGTNPSIIGGDFNAPAGDAIFDLLKERGFRDAFAEAGSGWPDTYPNYAPVLRIDHLWVNSQVKPVRASAVTTRYSDHRMVVCDFLLP
jgi:endonuclease/exonuclease/phosphatase (EEP) superfamily protein YafD